MRTDLVPPKSTSATPIAPQQKKQFVQHPFASAHATLHKTTGHNFGELATMGDGAPAQLKTNSKDEDKIAQRKDDLNQDPVAQQLPANEGGSALPSPIRAKFESAFQTDFGDVRIHEGPAAKSIGALAYTQGSHLHFASGQYNPNTQEGQALLGHELTHVLQQRSGRVTSPGGDIPINADPALEAEADTLGAQAAQGQVVSDVVPTNVSLQTKSDPALQCKDEEEGSMWDSLGSFVGSLGTPAGALSLGGSIMQGGAEAANSGLASMAGVTPGQITSVPGMSALGGITSGIGLVTGLMDAVDEEKPVADRVAGGLSAFSGGTGLLGMVPSLGITAGGTTGLTATATGAGALGTGGAFATTGAALGSAGAIAGAGAAGYGIGRLLDTGTDWAMDATGASDAIDDWRGISRGEGETGDYSISGMLGEGAAALDRGVSSLWADESEPAYTQTLGWKLAEVLPSWMQ